MYYSSIASVRSFISHTPSSIVFVHPCASEQAPSHLHPQYNITYSQVGKHNKSSMDLEHTSDAKLMFRLVQFAHHYVRLESAPVGFLQLQERMDDFFQPAFMTPDLHHSITSINQEWRRAQTNALRDHYESNFHVTAVALSQRGGRHIDDIEADYIVASRWLERTLQDRLSEATSDYCWDLIVRLQETGRNPPAMPMYALDAIARRDALTQRERFREPTQHRRAHLPISPSYRDIAAWGLTPRPRDRVSHMAPIPPNPHRQPIRPAPTAPVQEQPEWTQVRPRRSPRQSANSPDKQIPFQYLHPAFQKRLSPPLPHNRVPAQARKANPQPETRRALNFDRSSPPLRPARGNHNQGSSDPARAPPPPNPTLRAQPQNQPTRGARSRGPQGPPPPHQPKQPTGLLPFHLLLQSKPPIRRHHPPNPLPSLTRTEPPPLRINYHSGRSRAGVMSFPTSTPLLSRSTKGSTDRQNMPIRWPNVVSWASQPWDPASERPPTLPPQK